MAFTPKDEKNFHTRRSIYAMKVSLLNDLSATNSFLYGVKSTSSLLPTRSNNSKIDIPSLSKTGPVSLYLISPRNIPPYADGFPPQPQTGSSLDVYRSMYLFRSVSRPVPRCRFVLQ
ncbi:hypothetical protein LIER_11515 [Lithospermum erythrorhizon]|uniref:Uncharacterized protein n=1 Tax=Lithospermum erythrorhizon TaxID=34254 RepID=A0AAV3PNB8_LITER